MNHYYHNLRSGDLVTQRTTFIVLAVLAIVTLIIVNHFVPLTFFKDGEKMNWIDIINPPESHGYYLIYGSYARDTPKRVTMAYFDHKRKRFYQDNIISKNVTHWMPLPQKP